MIKQTKKILVSKILGSKKSQYIWNIWCLSIFSIYFYLVITQPFIIKKIKFFLIYNFNNNKNVWHIKLSFKKGLSID